MIYNHVLLINLEHLNRKKTQNSETIKLDVLL